MTNIHERRYAVTLECHNLLTDEPVIFPFARLISDAEPDANPLHLMLLPEVSTDGMSSGFGGTAMAEFVLSVPATKEVAK